MPKKRLRIHLDLELGNTDRIVKPADWDDSIVKAWSDREKRRWAERQLKLQYAEDEVFIANVGPTDHKGTAPASDAKDEGAQPPSSALLSALLPTAKSEDAIANLNEIFADTWLPRHGTEAARRIWMTQAARLVLLQWVTPLLNMLDKLRGIFRPSN